MHKVWSRAEPTRECKDTHDIFPKDLLKQQPSTFVPSYEKDEPAMSLLLGWEYGRLWLKEHKES
ncbi:uncharacterized protein LOC111599811 isoform X2 [Drosophila hydei]|uniref:Uncharacterized protein LOC111599811 isoform X2 n=1 Tax=Drosophila hydei TaxID=7224 RepID=A0A6J1M3Q8_DROHY|nr:uncharacterized protein LOC111599811 isoform X2 [Drosophila hydei]